MNTDSFALFASAVWDYIQVSRTLLLFMIGSVLWRFLVAGLQNIAKLFTFSRPQECSDDATFTLSMLPTFSLFQR